MIGKYTRLLFDLQQISCGSKMLLLYASVDLNDPSFVAFAGVTWANTLLYPAAFSNLNDQVHHRRLIVGRKKM
jgi:hypothetical protein